MKDQNWFAVLIDFAIVVFGVFIGIQVNAWNEGRIEQSLETSYLERLKNDVQDSRDSTKGVTDSWIAQVELLNLVLDSLDKCEIPEKDKDDFAEGLYNLGKFEMAHLNNSTLEEMKSTGRLGVIRNTTIRDALASIENQISYQERVELQIIARISPHVEYVNQRVRINIRSINQANEMNEKVGEEDFRFSEVASYNLNVLCQDTKVAASISNAREHVFEIMAWNLRIIDLMDKALTSINEELEK